MCEQNAYLAKHSELRVKKFSQISLENYSKCREQPLQHANFQSFSGGACLRTPPRAFLISQSASNLLRRKTPTRLKKCGNYDPHLSKFLASPLFVSKNEFEVKMGPIYKNNIEEMDMQVFLTLFRKVALSIS